MVKKTFSIIENAEGELRSVLPAAVASHIDWSTLRQVTEPSSMTGLDRVFD